MPRRVMQAETLTCAMILGDTPLGSDLLFDCVVLHDMVVSFGSESFEPDSFAAGRFSAETLSELARSFRSGSGPTIMKVGRNPFEPKAKSVAANDVAELAREIDTALGDATLHLQVSTLSEARTQRERLRGLALYPPSAPQTWRSFVRLVGYDSAFNAGDIPPMPLYYSFEGEAMRMLAATSTSQVFQYLRSGDCLCGGWLWQLTKDERLDPPEVQQAAVRRAAHRAIARAATTASWEKMLVEQSLKVDGIATDCQLYERLSRMAPEDFEQMIATLLERMGLANPSVTSYSNDGGVDIRGEMQNGLLGVVPVAVQVKRWSGTVQAPAIRDFRGALSDRENEPTHLRWMV